jgi:hypothetical protein
MAKEIALKIKVDGQEVVLSNKQVDLLKNNIVILRKELDGLGERTEQNAEQFDRLKGDLEALDVAFEQTKTEAKETGDAIQEEGNQTQEADKKTKSYAAQIKALKVELIGLGDRTAENAVQYDRLTSQIQELSDKQEDLQFGTRKLDDSLSAIPGPIGRAAQSFKMLDDGVKNARSAMATLARQFPLLDSAIAKTGIGALIVLFGLLVGAIIRAFQTFKPLQDAVGNMGTLFKVLGEAIQPLIDLIGKGLTVALEALAKGLAFVTGNLDEYNKAVADKKATEAFAANVKKQADYIDANADKYDEYTQRKLKANQAYNEKKVELDADETRSEKEKQALLQQYRDKADREIKRATADRQKKAEEDRKAAAEKAKQAAEAAAQIETDYLNKLRGIQNDNAILRLQDEAEKGRIKLKQELDNQNKEIEQLKVSEKKKRILRQETLTNYELKLKEFNDNILKEQKKADEDLAKQTRDFTIAAIADEKMRLQAEAAARRDDALKAIDEVKASEEAKAAAKLAINNKYAADIAKIDDDIAKKNRDTVYKQIEFERQSRQLGLENRLKEIDLSTQSELAKIQARSLVFQEQAKIDQEAEITNLKKLLETKEIDETEYRKRVAEIDKSYNLSIRENSLKTEQEIRDARLVNINLLNQLGGVIGTVAQAMGEESNAGKALIKVQQALALATTTLAIAEAFRGLGKDLAKGFPTNVIAVISTLALMATAFAQFKALTGKGPKDVGGGADTSSSSSSSQQSPNLGRNYATGGMIGGKRHAEGGTMIEAEAGEAIMTRGAVTMFAPMLSAMNQMGGGTAFNRTALTTSYDNPTLNKPAQSQEPIIMKTYVVSNELTTEAEKQARLKDLSTL